MAENTHICICEGKTDANDAYMPVRIRPFCCVQGSSLNRWSGIAVSPTEDKHGAFSIRLSCTKAA